jgi:hypothetical protein
VQKVEEKKVEGGDGGDEHWSLLINNPFFACFERETKREWLSAKWRGDTRKSEKHSTFIHNGNSHIRQYHLDLEHPRFRLGGDLNRDWANLDHERNLSERSRRSRERIRPFVSVMLLLLGVTEAELEEWWAVVEKCHSDDEDKLIAEQDTAWMNDDNLNTDDAHSDRLANCFERFLNERRNSANRENGRNSANRENGRNSANRENGGRTKSENGGGDASGPGSTSESQADKEGRKPSDNSPLLQKWPWDHLDCDNEAAAALGRDYNSFVIHFLFQNLEYKDSPEWDSVTRVILSRLSAPEFSHLINPCYDVPSDIFMRTGPGRRIDWSGSLPELSVRERGRVAPLELVQHLNDCKFLWCSRPHLEGALTCWCARAPENVDGWKQDVIGYRVRAKRKTSSHEWVFADPDSDLSEEEEAGYEAVSNDESGDDLPSDENDSSGDEENEEVNENSEQVDEENDEVDEENGSVNENSEQVNEENESGDEENEEVNENSEQVDEENDEVDDENESGDEENEEVNENSEQVDEENESGDEENESVNENSEQADDASESAAEEGSEGEEESATEEESMSTERKRKRQEVEGDEQSEGEVEEADTQREKSRKVEEE